MSWAENKPRKERAACLHKHLKDKKFLLIFDHVWEPLDLKAIGIPIQKGRKGMKMIVATRSLEICKRMEAKVVMVKKLHMQYACSLLLEKAGDSAKQLVMKNATRAGIVKDLLNKCDGLPEAVIEIGYSVSTKDKIDEWEHLLKRLKNKPWEVKGIKEILPKLKSSYDKLDPKSKTCLMYCALYPEGSLIYKQWIMDYCIGEGVIDDYNEGLDKMRKLEVASLLETTYHEDYVRMHPMVRAMMLWVANCEGDKSENKWLVQAGVKIKEAPVARLWTGAQGISLMENNIKSLSLTPNCPHLETLLIHENPELERISDSFFLYMPKLRVLDMSRTGIKQLPTGITQLVSLQYLDICGTKISHLPEELGALVNLRFLLLAFMANLQTIPSGVISKFCELQVLYMQNGYGEWKTGCDGTGLDLDELNNLTQLKAFGITIRNTDTLEKLGGSHRLAECTRIIDIDSCHLLKTISIHSIGGNFKDVRELTLVNCNDLKEVIIDGAYLQKLQDLWLKELENVKIIWSKGCFTNLSKLTMEKCRGTESLIYCNDEETVDPFPNLTDLNLIDLPQLKKLCSARSLALPSLECLNVDDCPNLKTLNMVADHLQIIYSSKSWLANVQSQDFDVNKPLHSSLDEE